MKKWKYLKCFILMALLIGVFKISANAAEPRLTLGYKWAAKDSRVLFYCNLNDTWKNSINIAMNRWNEVKDFNTNSDIVPLALSENSNRENKIYCSTTSQLWLAKTFPEVSNKNITSVDIVFNTKDYSYILGAAAGKYDIVSVAVHELGHAIGIAHCHELSDSSCFSSTCLSNVMNPEIPDNTRRRELTGYDSSSKQRIYW